MTASARKCRAPGRTLGVDLSLTNTGLVVLDEAGRVLRTGTIEQGFKRRKAGQPPPTPAEKISRLIAVSEQVVEIARDFHVHQVAIEEAAYSRRFQAHQLGEVQGALKVALWQMLKIVAIPAPMSSARLLLLGHGHAATDVFQPILTEKLGINVANDHEADAYVVAFWAFMQVARSMEEVAHG